MKKILLIKVIALVLAALVSFFVLAPVFEKPATYKHTIASLEERESTVYKLTVSSAIISTAIAAIPSDATTGVADSITDLNIFFVLCLTAILMEKYLITLVGFAAFRVLIPISCIFAVLYLWKRMPAFRKWAVKLFSFALIVIFVIPVSAKLGDQIVETNNSTINEVINTKEEDLSFIQKITTGVTKAVSSAQQQLKNCVNSASVMLLSACVMPLLVLLVFVWLINLFFGTNIAIPTFGQIKSFGKRRFNQNPLEDKEEIQTT